MADVIHAPESGNAVHDETSRRILDAAATLFFQQGYARTTTLGIAQAASVSKRTLYECFGTKSGILEALIRDGAAPMHHPLLLRQPADAAAFFETLRGFGRTFLKELFSPPKLAMYRLAIADTGSGVVARLLEENGRAPVVTAVRALFEQAIRARIVDFDHAEQAVTVFLAMLAGDLHLRLVMGTAPAPTARIIAQRADLAVEVLQLLARPGAPAG